MSEDVTEASEPAEAETHRARYRRDVRFIGAIPGRYTLMAAGQAVESDLRVYACRLSSISPTIAVMAAPVAGDPNEPVTAHFETFGIVRGVLQRHIPGGFAIELDMSEAERERLAGKIAWHKKHVFEQAPDRRSGKRFPPRNPHSVLTLAGGRKLSCFVIDLSPSGVAVSAAIVPQIGMPVAVGRLVGRVVRHFETGFAVQFLTPLDPDEVEARLLPAS
jgi:hypothetical protein